LTTDVLASDRGAQKVGISPGLFCFSGLPAERRSFTIYKPRSDEVAGMVDLIPFPLSSRASLVRSMVDDLECVNGAAANEFWRQRIASIVADMRESGLGADTIRNEILGLQDAVQMELRRRSLAARSHA
jgi:hypothetical protein